MTTHKDEIVERLLRAAAYIRTGNRSSLHADAIDEAADLIEQQASTIERMEEALGRISSNGFGHPLRTLCHKRDKEMLAMMDYARSELTNKERMDG